MKSRIIDATPRGDSSAPSFTGIVWEPSGQFGR